MKERLKKLQLLFYISLAGLLFFSCNKEDYDEQNQESLDNVKLSRKPFEQVIKTPKFNTAITTIVNSKKGNKNLIMGKTVMEDQYNFTISNNPVNIAELDSVFTYTMLINREVQSSESFENLVVQVDKNNAPIAFIFKYTPSITNETVEEGQPFQGTREITPIIYNSSTTTLTATPDEVCRTVISYYCANASFSHVPGVYPCQAPPQYIIECTPIPGGGGPTTPTTPTTPGGGSGSTTTPPIITSPNLPASDLPEETPCEKLKNNTNSPEYKKEFFKLYKQEIFDLEHESGFGQKKQWIYYNI